MAIIKSRISSRGNIIEIDDTYIVKTPEERKAVDDRVAQVVYNILVQQEIAKMQTNNKD